MNPRDILEKEIARVFNEQQLDSIIMAVLKKPLNHIVANARLPIMISGLLNALENDQGSI